MENPSTDPVPTSISTSTPLFTPLPCIFQSSPSSHVIWCIWVTRRELVHLQPCSATESISARHILLDLIQAQLKKANLHPSDDRVKRNVCWENWWSGKCSIMLPRAPAMYPQGQLDVIVIVSLWVMRVSERECWIPNICRGHVLWCTVWNPPPTPL